MNDMSAVITPKSDQLNSDDLIAGPMTVVITGVSIRPGGEQPVAISFKGDKDKPWKPCKSMCRCLVFAWGPDAKQYIGRSMTIYRDPAVKWAGMEVGGIRISHMSDIENPITMALTATKGSRKPHTVRPLAVAPVAAATQVAAPSTKKAESFDAAAAVKCIKECSTSAALQKRWSQVVDRCSSLDIDIPDEVHAAYTFAKESLAK